MTARILAFAGSIRRDSVNRRLAQAAVHGAEAAGAEVTWLELVVDFEITTGVKCQIIEVEEQKPLGEGRSC